MVEAMLWRYLLSSMCVRWVWQSWLLRRVDMTGEGSTINEDLLLILGDSIKSTEGSRIISYEDPLACRVSIDLSSISSFLFSLIL